MKICYKCGIKKPIEEFYKKKAAKDGFNSSCKSCDNEKGRIHYEANKDKYTAWFRAWRKANPEKEKDRAKKWRDANPDKVKARTKAWREANIEKLKLNSIVWRKENPDKAAEHNRNSKHKRRAQKNGGGGFLSKGLFDKLFTLQRGKCPVCKSELSRIKPRSPMDHIIPLALGGLNVDLNIQLLCRSCNSKKHARHPVEFMQAQGFLI